MPRIFEEASLPYGPATGVPAWRARRSGLECATSDTRRIRMSLRIGDEAPNFQAETTQGKIDFHEWIGDGWAILFSHPKDFTPVCTTELGYMARIKPEFDKRNCKILGISVDGVKNHEKWSKDIEASQGAPINYPLIGDPQLKV